MERGLPTGGREAEGVEPGSRFGSGRFGLGIVERGEGVGVRESRQCLIEWRFRPIGEGERGRARFASARILAELRAGEATSHPRFEVVEVTPDGQGVGSDP